MAATNRNVLRYDGRTGVSLTTGQPVPFATDASWAGQEADRARRLEQSRKAHGRLVNVGRVASIVPGAMAFAPGGVLGGMYSGGAAASSAGSAASSGGMWSNPALAKAAGLATSAGGTSAPAVGLGARLGSMMNSNGMNLSVNAGLSLLGNRSQNKAADQARRDTLAANAEALKVQREQFEMEARNAQLDREDARALNAAINELKKRELDAQEEQRAYDRGLIEQRETRLAPIRQRGAQAADRLSAMWGLK